MVSHVTTSRSRKWSSWDSRRHACLNRQLYNFTSPHNYCSSLLVVYYVYVAIESKIQTSAASGLGG